MGTEVGSAFVLALKYLAGLRCGGCDGRGARSGRACKMCEGSGFKGGDIHLLVSGKQIPGGGRR